MKNLLLTLILLLNSLMYSQQYVKLPLQNCYWTTSDYMSCYNQTSTPSTIGSQLVYNLYPTGTTTINQKLYTNISKSITVNNQNLSCQYISNTSVGYQCAIRQDTINKMVYVYFNNDPTERVLYNFNYVKGDSVKTCLGQIISTGFNMTRVVDSVYYHTYNDGISRKTFRLIPRVDPAGMQFHQYIIEGIGNEVGLLNTYKYRGYNSPGYGQNETWSSVLSINNVSVAPTPQNMYYNNVSILQQDIKTNVNLYPNPIENIINIDGVFLENSNSIIHIYDIYGKQISQDILNKQHNTIEISNLSSGIYFTKIYLGNEILNYKIVKE